jgi:glc operon protein GlcG
MRSLPTLDHQDAWFGIQYALQELKLDDVPFVIAIVDSHGETLALFRHSAAMLSSVNVAANKAYSAARLRRPSAAIGQKARDPEAGFDIAYFGDPRIVGFGGGIPVEYQGQVLGAIGISGLPEAEDIRIATLIAGAISARWST